MFTGCVEFRQILADLILAERMVRDNIAQTLAHMLQIEPMTKLSAVKNFERVIKSLVSFVG
jgi:hypothetical protein